MRARSLGVVFTAAMFLATVAFAQDTNNNNANRNNTTATNNQNAANNQGVQGNEVTGKVTKYTPGQSITVRTAKGSRNFDLKNAQTNVDPSVKVGSRVKVSETNNNGQRVINVEPAGAQGAGTAGAPARHGCWG